MKRLLVLLALSFSALAQTTTPILVPVLYTGGGVNGSQWFTLVSVNNTTSQTIDGRGVEFIIACPIPEGCFTGELRPGDTGGIVAPETSTGLLLHVPAAEAEQFEIQASFGESTRHRWGVQLPIAREKDFRETPFTLLNVPLNGDFRTTLRIYGLEPGLVRVEMTWVYQPDPIETRIVTLSTPSHEIQPAFAQLDLQREGVNQKPLRACPLPK